MVIVLIQNRILDSRRICFLACSPQWTRASHSRGFYITHNDAPQFSGRLIRSSLRPLADNTKYSEQTSIPLAGFEPTISAGELPQTQALDRAVTGTGRRIIIKPYTSGTRTKLDSVFRWVFTVAFPPIAFYEFNTLHKVGIEAHSVDLLIIWKHLGFHFAAGRKRERERQRNMRLPLFRIRIEYKPLHLHVF
jgi:hypothetical protein